MKQFKLKLKQKLKFFFFFILAFYWITIQVFYSAYASTHVASNSILSLEDYLKQVRQENLKYRGNELNQTSANSKIAEANLISSFNLTGGYQHKHDKKQTNDPFIAYDSIDTNKYSLGIKKVSTFGLESKLSYDVYKTEYFKSNTNNLNRTTSSPSLTLTQSLWQNAWGRLTQNNIDALNAQSENIKHSVQSSLDTIEQDVIAVYWDMVVKREIVSVQKLAVKHAQAIHDYVKGRVKMNLGEEADVLQAKASLETKKLDLQSAQNNELIQLRYFNKYRNRTASESPNNLSPINWDFLKSFTIPKIHQDRSDVLAAKYQAINSVKSYQIQEENNKPIFNAYLGYALNGNDNSFSESIYKSASTNWPTVIIGVDFSMPLDVASTKTIRDATKIQSLAEENIYQQKLKDQEAEWEDLREKIVETQTRIKLSLNIEEAQKKKLEFEHLRLKTGRTSTYQILQFEQDYTLAKLSGLQIVSEMYALLAKVRLYNMNIQY